MSEEEKRVLCDLMKRVSEGDETARETIAQKYYRIIYCFIFNIVKSEEDAQDLTQETFLRLCRHDFSVKVWHNGYVYLFQIAKNLCRDRFRKQKKADCIFKWETEKARRFIWDDPETFASLFHGLSEYEEKLVLLRYGRGYNNREIADKTGIPLRSLERKFCEIKEKIKKAADAAEETGNEA